MSFLLPDELDLDIDVQALLECERGGQLVSGYSARWSENRGVVMRLYRLRDSYWFLFQALAWHYSEIPGEREKGVWSEILNQQFLPMGKDIKLGLLAMSEYQETFAHYSKQWTDTIDAARRRGLEFNSQKLRWELRGVVQQEAN